jgi:hypothetical protein
MLHIQVVEYNLLDLVIISHVHLNFTKTMKNGGQVTSGNDLHTHLIAKKEGSPMDPKL